MATGDVFRFAFPSAPAESGVGDWNLGCSGSVVASLGIVDSSGRGKPLLVGRGIFCDVAYEGVGAGALLTVGLWADTGNFSESTVSIFISEGGGDFSDGSSKEHI